MGWYSSFARDDRVILATLSIGTAGLILAMYQMLKCIRDDAEIKPIRPRTQYITQDTEDSLKMETLETLLAHYNYAIRETAAKIVCDRAVNDDTTLEMLLYGITRPDYDERMAHLRCLAIVTDFLDAQLDSDTLHLLHTWKAYSAIVRSLELCLDPDQEPLDGDFDEYSLRDMAEKLCLLCISQLVGHYDAEKLIKAKFVEKWLAKQNWGSTPEAQLINFREYMHHRTNRITEIVAIVLRSGAGREALSKVGLFPSSQVIEVVDDQWEPFSVYLSHRSGQDDGFGDEPETNRSIEQSVEEQRLRHRHREAMVLNDGSRPLNSEDIFERNIL